MNDYKIPIIEPTIDYTKVPPINQKRTVSFINHFIIHTVTFLNKFALSCEERLFEFENKLQKVEASLEILESRLSSIPGLDQNAQTVLSEVTDQSEGKTEEPEMNEVKDTDTVDRSEVVEPKVEKIDSPPIEKDPRYEKYFKMVHFGVPKVAVALKMKQEGLDPSILDDPHRSISV